MRDTSSSGTLTPAVQIQRLLQLASHVNASRKKWFMPDRYEKRLAAVHQLFPDRFIEGLFH